MDDTTNAPTRDIVQDGIKALYQLGYRHRYDVGNKDLVHETLHALMRQEKTLDLSTVPAVALPDMPLVAIEALNTCVRTLELPPGLRLPEVQRWMDAMPLLEKIVCRRQIVEAKEALKVNGAALRLAQLSASTGMIAVELGHAFNGVLDLPEEGPPGHSG